MTPLFSPCGVQLGLDRPGAQTADCDASHSSDRRWVDLSRAFALAQPQHPAAALPSKLAAVREPLPIDGAAHDDTAANMARPMPISDRERVPEEVFGAACRGDIACVKDWLAAGGDPNARADYFLAPDGSVVSITGVRGSPLLVDLVKSDAPREITALLRFYGARLPPTVVLNTALHHDPKALRAILSYGADPNDHVTDYHGHDGIQWTALHVACRLADPRIAATLLEFGADVNVRLSSSGLPPAETLTDEGWPLSCHMTTPLMCAACTGYCSEIIRVLLSYGADVNARNPYGRTALYYAHVALNRNVAPLDKILDDDDEDFDIYCRVAGEVERTIDLLTAVRSAGSWRRFSNEPRRQVLILQKLAAAKRASPPASMARLFSLTPELLWVVLRYWRTARDPLYSTVQRMP